MPADPDYTRSLPAFMGAQVFTPEHWGNRASPLLEIPRTQQSLLYVLV